MYVPQPAAFSFQIVSTTKAWDLRVFPRDAVPSGRIHVNQKGVLQDGEPEAVAAVAGEGREGHGHNFHIVEAQGTKLTIWVRRQPLDGGQGGADASQDPDQLRGLGYQVWYEKETAEASADQESQFTGFRGGDGIDLEKQKGWLSWSSWG